MTRLTHPMCRNMLGCFCVFTCGLCSTSSRSVESSSARRNFRHTLHTSTTYIYLHSTRYSAFQATNTHNTHTYLRMLTSTHQSTSTALMCAVRYWLGPRTARLCRLRNRSNLTTIAMATALNSSSNRSNWKQRRGYGGTGGYDKIGRGRGAESVILVSSSAEFH